MSINIIVAVGNGGAIGHSGKLSFYIPADLKRFKDLTMGHPIIMGRLTFDSLPKGALPGRRNIVITRNPDWSAPNVETASSLEDAIRMTGDDAFIIGGGQVYRQALPIADKLYITRIYEDDPEADTFFPDITPEFVLVEESPIFNSPLPHQFLTYSRTNKA